MRTGLLITRLFSTVVATQNPEPRPEDAIKAILAAFETYDVVGMDAAHDNKVLDDFILSLIRNPEVARRVNDIVVECGNRRYQALLDRYIAGDDVSLAEARQVWRNTTVLMCGVSGSRSVRLHERPNPPREPAAPVGIVFMVRLSRGHQHISAS
jgi:hypothetical protein